MGDGSCHNMKSWDQTLEVVSAASSVVIQINTLSPARDLGSVVEVEHPQFIPLKEVLSFLRTPAGKGYGAIWVPYRSDGR